MLQIQGGEGEAEVVYREPSTTKEMAYHRLSRRVNVMASCITLKISPRVTSTKGGYSVRTVDHSCSSAGFAMLFM
jgi:hypothetical protein